MNAYLAVSDVIDWSQPAVLALARHLATTRETPVAIAQACFTWVRDEIYHSADYQMNPVTWRASDVLKHRTGFCFAKSHLLAALLRANQIPAGFCYQRLSIDDQGAPYSLHGFNAAYLPPFGWYRLDPRGPKPGIYTRFAPPGSLAYQAKLPGEMTFPVIWAAPLSGVVAALQQHRTWDTLLQNLPDRPSTEASMKTQINLSQD